jgi:crotonobetainyl-CoA:carnitine CoA-transferase CaiB-like acyl-CoA transferase
MERFGGGLAVPEEHAHLGTIDVVSGWSGAYATCLSIFKRLRTGQVGVASTSLAANAQLIQTPYMLEISRASSHGTLMPRNVHDEECARGPHAKGDNALYSFYSTNDSSVFLAAPFDPSKRSEAAAKLAASLGFEMDLLPPPPPAGWSNSSANRQWYDAIGTALAKMDSSTAIDMANSAGVAACRLTSMTDVRRANVDVCHNGYSGEMISVLVVRVLSSILWSYSINF